jgi:hypothetical protein
MADGLGITLPVAEVPAAPVVGGVPTVLGVGVSVLVLGLPPVVPVDVAGAVAVAVAVPGGVTRKDCPTAKRFGSVRLFQRANSCQVRPYDWAMRLKVSPGCTTCTCPAPVL